MVARKRYSFFINESQAAALKLLKEREERTEAELIREALTEYLRRKGAMEKAPRPRAINTRKRG